jgi:tellurite resistance protein
MDAAARQRICQLVAGIIIADDILDDKEEAFLDRMIKSFEIEGGRDVVFPLVDHNEAADQIKQLAKPEQEEALRLLIEAACVDGQIVPEEREYLRAIAGALALPEAELEKRIASGLAAR